MSSRDSILKAVKQNRPASIPMPQTVFVRATAQTSLLAVFIENLLGIGAGLLVVDNWDPINEHYHQKQGNNAIIANCIAEADGYNLEQFADKNAVALEKADTVFVKGALAVAENGAVWLSEKALGNRLLPFITENLVIVIHERDIVANMHEAYAKINVTEDGYGVFIAGPSKTADIEQSLVIGAHGPLSLQVFILKNMQD